MERGASSSSLETLETAPAPEPLACGPSEYEVFADACAKLAKFSMDNPHPTEADVAQQQAADAVVQVVVSCHAPYRILWMSKAWLKVLGFEHREVIGRTLSIIQGPISAPVEPLIRSAKLNGSVESTVINHSRSRMPFVHTVHIRTLHDDKGTERFMQITSRNVLALPPAAFEAALQA